MCDKKLCGFNKSTLHHGCLMHDFAGKWIRFQMYCPTITNFTSYLASLIFSFLICKIWLLNTVAPSGKTKNNNKIDNIRHLLNIVLST